MPMPALWEVSRPPLVGVGDLNDPGLGIVSVSLLDFDVAVADVKFWASNPMMGAIGLPVTLGFPLLNA